MASSVPADFEKLQKPLVMGWENKWREKYCILSDQTFLLLLLLFQSEDMVFRNRKGISQVKNTRLILSNHKELKLLTKPSTDNPKQDSFFKSHRTLRMRASHRLRNKQDYLTLPAPWLVLTKCKFIIFLYFCSAIFHSFD